MPSVLLLHGANLNLLGKRDPTHYGDLTLAMIEKLVRDELNQANFDLIAYQSNHEGNLIDMIQAQTPNCVGIIINPGAFTHYSYAIHDAILDSNLPTVEVHLSNIALRESWRSHSVIAPACIATISGEKEHGYRKAVQTLLRHIHENK